MIRRFRPCWAVLVCCALLWVAVPTPALAGPIASKTVPTEEDQRRAQLDTVEAVLARAEVVEALTRLGLEAHEIETRVSQLSDADLGHLAANLDQVQAAGTDVPEYIWWLVGGLLAVLILAAVF